MRSLLIAASLLALVACGDTYQAAPVDPVMVGPMSGKEQALLVAAEGSLHTGDTTNAERDYLQGISLSRGHVEAHLGLARLYISEKREDQAEEVLKRAQKLQPKNPDVNYLLGRLALNQDRAKEADEAFARGLQAAPSNLELLNGAGIAADLLGNHEQAQAHYLQAIRSNPKGDLSLARTNLAMSYLLTGQPKKAIPPLEIEAKRPGASAVTRHNLALAYGMVGRNTEAKKLLGADMTEEERRMMLERLKQYIATEPRAATPANTPGGPKGGGKV